MNFFKILFDRLTSDMPSFWKRFRLAGASIFASAIAVKTANAELGLALADFVIVWCNYAMAVGIAMAGTASLTTTDNELSRK